MASTTTRPRATIKIHRDGQGVRVADPSAAFDDDFHKSIVDHLADGVYYVDRQRSILYWNRGAERITGYPAGEVVGRRCFDNILSHVDGAGRQLCLGVCPLAASMRDDEPYEVEVWLRHRDGHRVPVRVRTAPIHDADGNVRGAVEVFDDASRLVDARRVAAAASRDALTDPLTGLPNRRQFDLALEGCFENLQRYGWGFALLIVDIDHFKAVNDEHGHETGDAALRTVASTIGGGIRVGDIAARWGGEEFAILANGVDEAGLHELGERVRALVASSVVRHEGREVTVRVSIGAAMAEGGEGPHELLARADAALYVAKSEGRDRLVLAPSTAG
jgi:diguanylate cyclase (GGDEF)-like protein/PAS domain S-box-containing protein